MAEVVVTMSGDEAKLWKAQARILEQQKKLSGGYGELAGRSKLSAKAAREEAAARVKAEREHQKELAKGKALTESLRTPQERYNASVAESAELQKKGAISAETHRRRVEQLSAELASATGETARASRVEKARVEVLARSGKMTQDAERHLKKYAATLKELDAKQKAGKISAEELAHAQGKAKAQFTGATTAVEKQNGLIGTAITKLGGYATAAGAAALAVKTIQAAWETVVQEQEKGLDALKKTEDTGRALLQISDSPEQFQQLRSQAQNLSSSTGVDISTVESVLFSAVSEGFRDAVPELIAANQVISPESAAGVAGQVPALFKGQISALESVDLTLKAARDSRLNFEEIAKSLPSAAEGGGIANATAEETLAVLSVLAAEFKSGDVAADRIKGFATKLGIDQGGTTDEDLQKAVEAEKARVAAAEKSLRAKEERVSDLERRVNNSRGATAETATIQLERARRDVAEFDRSRLQFNAPEAGRSSLAGIGIVAAVEQLQQMDDSALKDFLGDSQELNVAYVKLSDNLDTIKQRIAEIEQERRNFAEGGGILRDRVATANSDPELIALKENNIATQKLEQTIRDERGIQGAAADSAVKGAEGDLLANGSFAQRTLDRALGVSGIASRSAVALGADSQTAAAVGVGANEGFTSGLLGQQNAGAFKIFGQLLSGQGSGGQGRDLEQAARDLAQGAADLKSAASNMRPAASTPSVTDAARIQAGQSVRGD